MPEMDGPDGAHDASHSHAAKSLLPRTSSASKPIAIIGMSCNLPGGATSPDKLWRMCVEGRSGWSEIPKSRFNGAAFYDEDQQKTSTTNVKGGHFLSGDISAFDASFFNLSAEAASAMDPQMRLQLESVYEATEDAGLSLEGLAGTNTSVFASCFVRDYNDSLTRDVDTVPRTMITGNGAAMLSNRVSHFFDLRGPSMTIDTGCSTGLTAFHIGCQSLETGDSDIAIVAAANMMLNPDYFIILSNLGVLSPDGRCYAWDDRANGYGRGEGIVTLILKPLEQAINDCDNIRAVVRRTSINQDGKTPTITSPSAKAQEIAIRDCYRRAGLDPSQTPYVEAHMTGTLTGDPIEAEAIGQVFGSSRSGANPTIVGSIKTNLGHLESASGLAGIVKAVLALEKKIIPPNLNFARCNPAIDMEFLNVKVTTEPIAWPEHSPCRASVNNFGYGGSNAHAILDAYPLPASSQPKLAVENSSDGKYRAIVLSSKDGDVTKRMMENLAEFVNPSERKSERIDLANLAYTLAERRSQFPWRCAVSVNSAEGLVSALRNAAYKPVKANVNPNIGFVFTGQGAQWATMGKELFSYPVFASAMQEADDALKSFGAEWSLIDEILKDASISQVHSPAFMVLSIALQMCMFRLLVSWGISPCAVTSHSSGEVSAAYAVGALTFTEALGIVYFRGKLAENYQNTSVNCGAMLAAGIGAQDATSYAERLTSGKVVVACVNSPSSVTMSGDLAAVEELGELLQKDGIFARRLKVNAAYHSHHMEPMSEEYRQCLQKLITVKDSWSGIAYGSPVTGKLVNDVTSLGADNWVQNLVQPVLFDAALKSICAPDSTSPQIDILLEIGPHGALAGPIRQNLSSPSLKEQSISYYSCLTRNEDAVHTMQTAVCALYSKGFSVDLRAVNKVASEDNLRVLSDLPAYPWNHATKYWKESRLNYDHRNRTYAQDELLGRSILGVTPQRPCWRHFLTTADLPWLRDHTVQSDIVFPGAGMVSMAVQAMQQVAEQGAASIEGYKLRNVGFMNALVIPDTTEGVEVQMSFSPCSSSQLDDQGWWDFDLYSVASADSSWIKHCKGSICVVPLGSSHGRDGTTTVSSPWSKSTSCLTQKNASAVDPAGLFARLRSRGIFHGPSLRNIVSILTNGVESSATLRISDCDSRKLVIHPTTLDSIFVTSYAALANDAFGDSPVLPHSVKELYISQSAADSTGHTLSTRTIVERQDKRGLESSIDVSSESCSNVGPLVRVRGFYCQAFASTIQPENGTAVPKNCFKTSLAVDWTTMSTAQLEKALVLPLDPQEVLIGRKLVQATFYFIHDTLSQLSETDIAQFDWHQVLFLQWMQNQHRLGIEGKLASDSTSWQASDVCSKQQVFEEVCAESVNGRLVCKVGRNLLDILRHQTTPLELMMQENLLFDFYEQSIRTHRSYAQVKRLITHFAHKTPRGKILEIGGGTGGCTAPVLEVLSGEPGTGNHLFTRYDFTDISSGFFEKAAIKFSRWSDVMTFKKLDIEDEPSAQGFELGSYDLIIACQVLHATKKMETTMSHVRRLLKPGGTLVMVETTKDTPDMQLIFGTLPGWWLGEGRTESPNMPVETWRKILITTGFNGLDVEIGDCEDRENYSFSTMVATASRPTARYPDKLSIIVPPGVPGSWLDSLKASIAGSTGIATIEEELAATEPRGRFYIYLLDLLAPWLPHLDPQSFESLRCVLAASAGGLWVSCGGLSYGASPDHALHLGILRTLRLEDASKRLISCDFPLQDDPWTIANCRLITEVVRSTFDLNLPVDSIDTEYAVRNAELCITRLVEDPVANDAAAALTNATKVEFREFIGSPTPLRIDVGTTGYLESIRFVENNAVDTQLEDGYIEVEPKAFGVNFRDVLVALGHIDGTTLGYECGGIVTKLGRNTEESGLQVGHRVCAIMQGHYGTPVRIHWTWAGRISDKMSFEVAASIPMAFVTAYQSLYESARLEEGETVLIHAAAGAVGQAAIMLAQHRKAEVFVTVSTQAKRDLMMQTYGILDDHISSSRDTSFASLIMTKTRGKGVDVVLNSLSGKLLEASWDCIASFGRFIEIGKRDIEQNKALPMAPLRRAASFAAIDLDHMTRLRGHVVVKAFREVLKLWDCHHIKAVVPIKTFPMSDLAGAFRFMQAGKHLGKIVIVPERGDLVKVLPAVKHVKFMPNASYMLAGGVGGIGRGLARHMASLGCKSLVMTSRSAESHQTVPELVEDLERLGCRAIVRNCDVSDASSLASLLSQLEHAGVPSVRGVVQAAMALKGSIFEHMTFDTWQAALRPKYAATWNLHNQLSGLDFFVMLSSIAGVAGSSGQANYSAGSAFQDAFAQYRTARGLPAVSIDLGPIKGIGYVADDEHVMAKLVKTGHQPIERLDALSIIESAMLHPLRSLDLSQVITGIRQWETNSDVAWEHDLRFRTMQQVAQVQRTKGASSSGTAISFKDTMTQATSWEEVVQICTEALVQRIAVMFSLKAADVDPALGLATYGVDSLVAVEMRNWLAGTTAAKLSIFDIMQSTSVASLAKKVAQKSSYVPDTMSPR